MLKLIDALGRVAAFRGGYILKTSFTRRLLFPVCCLFILTLTLFGGASVTTVQAAPIVAPMTMDGAKPQIAPIQVQYSRDAHWACLSRAHQNHRACMRSCSRNPRGTRCATQCNRNMDNACRHLRPRSSGTGRGATR